jgi:hypothetical protein
MDRIHKKKGRNGEKERYVDLNLIIKNNTYQQQGHPWLGIVQLTESQAHPQITVSLVLQIKYFGYVFFFFLFCLILRKKAKLVLKFKR